MPFVTVMPFTFDCLYMFWDCVCTCVCLGGEGKSGRLQMVSDQDEKNMVRGHKHSKHWYSAGDNEYVCVFV